MEKSIIAFAVIITIALRFVMNLIDSQRVRQYFQIRGLCNILEMYVNTFRGTCLSIP